MLFRGLDIRTCGLIGSSDSVFGHAEDRLAVYLERRGAVKAHCDLMPAQHLDIVPVVYVLALENGRENSQRFELA